MLIFFHVVSKIKELNNKIIGFVFSSALFYGFPYNKTNMYMLQFIFSFYGDYSNLYLHIEHFEDLEKI